jgi:hypothetical protein
MENKDLFELVNIPFTISFNGKEYTIRKANLEKAVLYQNRLRELVTQSDPSVDIKIAAYCLFLVLNEIDSSVTEEFIMKNAPASFSPVEWIEVLGFMTPQRKIKTQEEKTSQ